MREILIRSWCDYCVAADPDSRTAADATYSVAIAEGENVTPTVRVLELCETHGKELATLLELVRKHGVLAAKLTPTPRPAGVPLECPVCHATLGSRGSLQGHMRHQHGQTLSQYQGRLPRVPATCPECGHVAQNPQGLGAHRRAQHGVMGKALRGQ